MTQLTLDLDASTWTRVKLGAVVNRLTNGYVGPTRGLYQERGVPYLLARHVKSNRLTFDGKTFVTHEFNQKNKKSILKAGDVLLVQSGHIGESAVVTPEHEGHNCHAMIVISPKEDKLNGKFLSWYFSSHTGRSAFRRIQTGITIEHLNCRDVKEIEIPLPPLEEQRRIAAILDKADAVRRKRKEAIALTEELLRLAFLEMFGDPVTNPKGWEVMPMHKVIQDIEAGWSANGEERRCENDEWGVLKISAVTSGRFQANEHKVVEEPSFKKPPIIPQRGDLLFSRANTRELVAATCLVEKDYERLFLPDKLWRIKPEPKVANAEYLRFLLSDTKYRSLIAGKATSRKHILAHRIRQHHPR